MTQQRPLIPLSAITSAVANLSALGDNTPFYSRDFAILHPKLVEFCKQQEGFEPLSAYIDEVNPYDGEVGRYDAGGTKIRIIQHNGLR